MKILCIGDVCGHTGCEVVEEHLRKIKNENKIDLCIVNGENSADGNGILPKSALRLFDAGADVITGGNHTLQRREIYDELDSNPYLLRPANYPESTFGKGYCVVDFGKYHVAVVNISGLVYLDSLDSPFSTADRIIEKLHGDGIKNIIVDFHAEVTSEKRAFGFYLDGRVSAVYGTHTHIPTADADVLPNGTGYITDIGMCGSKHSVLGVKKEIIVSRFVTKIPERFVIEDEPPFIINGCIFEIDENTGKCLNAELLTKEFN